MKDSLAYHRYPEPGKIETVPTKNCQTQRDLSLAYTPGVADPCLEIADNPSLAGEYTNRGNLVAVISNGTAVLGLGNIGPLAGKPVMEGKAVLFKRFAGIDVFDIEISENDPDMLVRIVQSMEPTFGGINLEDIKAPECFIIEDELKKRLSIPVFHDDQHGTAIISGAALLNAVEISGKDISTLRVVVNGAGAAGIACADFYVSLGVRKENLILCDSTGVVYSGRAKGMNAYKERYAVKTDARTLSDAVAGSDLFLGLSVAGALTPDMLKRMNSNPIIFALANPTPEIFPDQALEARPDAIIATGRSDFPNQVNNVLGFPFIFRGALDVGADSINEPMKIAASRALAALAREEVPEEVKNIYQQDLSFGRDYIIPKPFDRRVFINVSSAVAGAAISSGVAKKPYSSEGEYLKRLEDLYERKIAPYNLG